MPQGEILLQLDSESYRIALLQAEAALRQAVAQADQAGREHQRTTTLARRSAVSNQSVERAGTAVQTGRAAVKQAEAAVLLARRNLRESTIRCPFAGTVADTMVELGQTVGPQTPLARIVDTTTLKLRLSVSVHELGRLRVGMAATLVDPTQPGRRFAGKVSRLGVAGDPATHTFPVEIEVPGGDPSPGQVVRAQISVASHARTFTVSEEALVEGALMVVRGGKARRVRVTAGARVGSRVLISAGLAAGDEVIVVGNQGLEDGDPVEVVARSGHAPAAGKHEEPDRTAEAEPAAPGKAGP